MAKGYYQKLYNSLGKYKGTPNTSSTSYKIKNLQNQINNKVTRLQSSGVDTTKTTDTRNGLEKFLGLPENQNVIFDVFDILNRPQQALFGAVNAAQKDEDVGKAAISNLKGDTSTKFKDILTQAGMSDTKGKLDLSDVLGFLGDVTLDPMNIPLIPVSTTSKLVDSAGKVADTVNDVSKIADTVNDVSKVTKAVDTAKDVSKVADTASDIAKGTEAVKNGLQLKSANDLILEGAGNLVKGGAKLADKGIENGLKYLDKTKGVEDASGNVTKLLYDNPLANSAANLGKKTIEGANTNVVGRFETYKDIKDTLNRAFNYVANVPEKVRDAVKKNNAESVRTATELKPIYDDLDNSIKDYATKVAEKTGNTSAENIAKISEQTDKNLSNLKEFMNINREVDGAELYKEAKNGTLTAKDAGEDGLNLLQSMADDINKSGHYLDLSIDVDDKGIVRLSKDWNNVTNTTKKNINNITKEYGEDFVKNLEGLSLDPDKLAQKVTKMGNYTEKDLDEFGKLLDKYKDDDDFKALYDKSNEVFNKSNEIIDKHFGTNITGTYKDDSNLGYVRHPFDKEQYGNYQKLGFVSPYGNVTTKGNAKILANRKYNMSAREANNMFKDSILQNYDTLTTAGKQKADSLLKSDGIFKEGITSSFDDYLRNVPQLASDSKMIDSVLVNSTFGDYSKLKDTNRDIKALNEYIENGTNDTKNAMSRVKKLLGTDLSTDNAKKIVSGLETSKVDLLNNSNMKILTNADSTIPKGFQQLNSDEIDTLVKKMNKISDELGMTDMKNIASDLKNNGKNIAINSDLLRLVGVNTDTKGVKGLSRLYDKYLGFFKKNKVLSPTFQMNNLLSNTSNMYLAGISPTEQAKLFPDAINILNNGEDLMIKASQGVELTEKQTKMLDIWNKYLDAGLEDAKSLTAFNLNDMPDSLKGYFTGEKEFKTAKDFMVDGLPYINNKMNMYLDTASRLVTFMEGENNPSFLSKLGVNSAGDAVRKVLFDPTELTTFERNTMKKIIPFYTFTKKNLAFQLNNLTKNGSQYAKLLKGYDDLLDNATDDNSTNASDWLRNNLYIPIPAIGKDGSYKVIRATLPFGNFIDTVNNPLNTAVSTVTPLVKMPFELLTGVNSFTGSDIEKFKGQKSTNIPGLTKMQEYLLGNSTGLDVPMKVASRGYNGIKDTMTNGGNLGDGILKGLSNMTTMDNNINTDKLNRMYDTLDELEKTMKQYKQKGYEFSTINELKKANKNSTSSKIMSTINKLNGLKSNPYSVK